MATLELDPLFVKALRLLHSKSKDSTEQLKQLLDDALHHHTPSTIYGQDSKDTLSSIKISVNYGSKKSSPKHVVDGALASKKSLVTKDEEVKRKEPEKRSFDKLVKQDVVDQSQEAKKPRLSSPKTVVIRSPSPVVIKEDDLTSDENTSATDIALEMGLACVVCRSFDVTSGNTLVECQDCHSLYHQECHKPPITDQDVNDPRLVWYCAKCTKNMKKMASKSQKSVKPVATTSSKDNTSLNKTVKQEPVVVAPPSTHIFKRVEPKVTTAVTSSTSSANKPIGLAGLAASLSGKSHSAPKPPQPSGGKPLTAMKSLIAASCNIKSSSSSSNPTSSIISKGNSFSILLQTKSGSQGGGSSNSSSSSASQTSGNSEGNKSSASFTSKSASSSSSSTNLVTTVSSSKAASSSSAGGNGTSSSSSSLPSKSASSSSLMSADKRLQIMKKKAAAKMQEKRRLSSK